VHHSHYLVWFEAARVDLMRSSGLPYGEVEEEGVYMPVVSARCRYLRPTRFDQLLTVRARVASFRGLRVLFHYSILDEHGVEVAEGETKHTLVDASGRPVNLRRKNPRLWTRIVRALRPEGGTRSGESVP